MFTPKLARTRSTVLCVMIFCFANIGLSQVSSTAPQAAISSTPIFINYSRSGPGFSSAQEILDELIDPVLLHGIAKSSGLSEADLATVNLVHESKASYVELQQIKIPDKAYKVLNERLRSYANERSDGHTKEFLLAAMTNSPDNSIILDHDLAVLIREKPDLPANLLKKYDSGTKTNKAGEIVSQGTTVTIVNGRSQTNVASYAPKQNEVCRWDAYFVVDGGIAWTYFLQLKADGSLDYVREEKEDAKEFDPQYKTIIQAVDAEVEAEMKAKGTYHKFGSIHTYWRLKQDKLKAKGIEWRSPAQLNPNIVID